MSKIISVSNKVYEKLKSMKGENESFSVVIERISTERTNKQEILKFAGKGGMDDKAMKEIKRGWKRWSKKYV